MANFGILAKLGLDASGLKKGLSEAKGSAEKFGVALGAVVKAGAIAAGAAITAMTMKGVKDFVEFEKKMSEVFTLLPGASQKAMGALTDDMRELARTIGIDTTDAVNGLYQAISAGVPKENAADFLKIAAKAAIAGVSDLETSVGALTTILNGYSMETSQAERVSDVLFSVVKNGVTTFGELGTNIGKVTPLAAALGISIEDLGGMFVVLTKQMGAGKTAEAATSLRSMLAELGKASMKAFKNFQEASGTTFPKFIKEGGSVKDALKLLTEHAERSGKSLVDMFRGVEAGMGALMLAKNGTRDLGAAMAAVAGDTGAMRQAYEVMAATTAQKMEQMKASMKDMGMTLGAIVMPMVQAAVGGLTKTFDVLRVGVTKSLAWIEENPRTIRFLVKSFKALAAVLLLVQAKAILLGIGMAALRTGMIVFNLTIGKMIAGWRALTIAMAANPIGAIVAVAAAAAAILAFGSAAGDAAKAVKEGLNEVLQQSRDRTENLRESTKRYRQETKDLLATLTEMQKMEALGAAGVTESQSALEIEKDRLATARQRYKEGLESHARLTKEEDKARKDALVRLKEFEKLHKKAEDRAIFRQGLQEGYAGITRDLAALEKEIATAKIDEADALRNIKDLTEKVAAQEAGRIKSFKEAKQIIEDTRREWSLSRTEMGKVQLLNEKVIRLERERKALLAPLAKGRALEADSLEKLKKLDLDLLNTEKQIADILGNRVNKLRAQEVKILQDELNFLQGQLALEGQLADAAREGAKAAEDRVAVLRKAHEEAVKGVDAQRKFWNVDVKGNPVANVREMRKEFNAMRRGGTFKGTFKEFEEMKKEEMRAAVAKRDAIVKEGKDKKQEAAELRKKEGEHIKKWQEISDKIVVAKTKLLDRENELLDKEKKTLEQITDERIKLENALGDVRDALAGAQGAVAPPIAQAMQGLGNQLGNLGAVIGNAAGMAGGASAGGGLFGTSGGTGGAGGGSGAATETEVSLPDVEGDQATDQRLDNIDEKLGDIRNSIEGGVRNL